MNTVRRIFVTEAEQPTGYALPVAVDDGLTGEERYKGLVADRRARLGAGSEHDASDDGSVVERLVGRDVLIDRLFGNERAPEAGNTLDHRTDDPDGDPAVERLVGRDALIDRLNGEQG